MSLLSRRRPRRYSASAGLPFDDDELESRLIWIWTSARSGSTWLLRLLSHPLRLVDGSQSPDDMLGFRVPERSPAPVDVIPVDTTFLANHLAPLARSLAYDETYTPVTFGMFPGMAERPNYFFSSKYQDVWRPELRRLALVRFHALIERTAARYEVSDPRVVLKEVAGAHAADLVMSLFPRSRLIFLVRDGRDVVDSQVDANRAEAWLPTAVGFADEAARLEFVRERSHAWVGDVLSVQRALAAHRAELRYTVRYEDLLADPARALGALTDWLGLERGAGWLERAVATKAFDNVPAESRGPMRFYRAATPGFWRESLAPSEQQVANEVMGDKLAELGYAP